MSHTHTLAKQQKQISDFLEEVRIQVNAMALVRKELARAMAPDFNFFSLFRTDETTLSKAIAFLLDPSASHGQELLFLHLFVEHFGFVA